MKYADSCCASTVSSGPLHLVVYICPMILSLLTQLMLFLIALLEFCFRPAYTVACCALSVVRCGGHFESLQTMYAPELQVGLSPTLVGGIAEHGEVELLNWYHFNVQDCRHDGQLESFETTSALRRKVGLS